MEALQRKRRDLLESIENVPVVVVDPEDDRLFEATALALDALRFAGVVFQVFPEFAHVYDRWWVARAILAQEKPLREALTTAIRARHYVEEFDPIRMEVQAMIIAQRPEWFLRTDELRSACREALRYASEVPTDCLDEEANAVFSVLAVSDERVQEIFGLIESDPLLVGDNIRQSYDLITAVRSTLPAIARPIENHGLIGAYLARQRNPVMASI
jgi:hypothetical protein